MLAIIGGTGLYALEALTVVERIDADAVILAVPAPVAARLVKGLAVQPGRLKAVLRIPETQARDVAIAKSHEATDARPSYWPARAITFRKTSCARSSARARSATIRPTIAYTRFL